MINVEHRLTADKPAEPEPVPEPESYVAGRAEAWRELTRSINEGLPVPNSTVLLPGYQQTTLYMESAADVEQWATALGFTTGSHIKDPAEGKDGYWNYTGAGIWLGRHASVTAIHDIPAGLPEQGPRPAEPEPPAQDRIQQVQQLDGNIVVAYEIRVNGTGVGSVNVLPNHFAGLAAGYQAIRPNGTEIGTALRYPYAAVATVLDAYEHALGRDLAYTQIELS